MPFSPVSADKSAADLTRLLTNTLPAQVSILFEVEDLSQASPATVSRAGMIYLNVEDLGWWPYVTSWLQKKQAAGADQVLLDTLKVRACSLQ